MTKRLQVKYNLALKLREEGKSYSEIKLLLVVSKSTLSLWLRDHPLNQEQLYNLQGGNHARIEKFRKTMLMKKHLRLEALTAGEKKKLLPLTEKELYLAGLFLYWGEGLKAGNSEVCIGNTDPRLMKFFVHWLIHSVVVDSNKLRVRLQLYSDMNIAHETSFWSKTLNLPIEQFRKPYIKTSIHQGLSFRSFNHGTCEVRAADARLKEKIAMGIKAISWYYDRI